MNNGLNFINKGTGLPFVYQHGLGGDLSQINLFTALQNIQLIGMDSSGHGLSQFYTDKQPSFNRYADDLIELLDKLGVEKAVFGGVSMGSAVALNIAVRYPERVKGLVLVRPAWLATAYPANLNILLEVVQALERNDGMADFELTPSFKNLKSISEKAAASTLNQFTRIQVEHSPIILERMIGDKPIDSLNQLSHIDIPTLVIGTQEDPLHPFNMAEVISNYIPNGQLEEIISKYVDADKHHQRLLELVKAFFKKISL